MKPIIKMFYDVETTGVDYKKHSLHQLAGFIEINDEIVETFDIRSAPHPKAKIEPEAMNICGVTEEQIRAYPSMDAAYRKFRSLIQKYIDQYNPKEKMHLIGYNNRAFDDFFLRMFFELNNDKFIGSYFWADTIDVIVLASEYLKDRRSNMTNFKQHTVATELGIPVNNENLHNAFYDVELTRNIYRIVTGIDFEI